MPLIVQFFVVTFVMLFAFLMFFLLIYLIARVLFPIEKGISNMIRSGQDQPVAPQPKVSFKDFSKKHKR